MVSTTEWQPRAIHKKRRGAEDGKAPRLARLRARVLPKRGAGRKKEREKEPGRI